MEILKEIAKFFIQYWRETITVLAGIISLCVAIFRKRPKTVLNVLDSVLVYLDEILPRFINDAELLPGLKGEDKLALVIESSNKELVKKFGYRLDSNLIKSKVEAYLSTPEAHLRKELTR